MDLVRFIHSEPTHLSWERAQKPVQDGRVHHCEHRIREIYEVNDVEVPDVALRDMVAATAGRAHGCHEVEVNQFPINILLEVVPACNK
jgi:hypothetical protein